MAALLEAQLRKNPPCRRGEAGNKETSKKTNGSTERVVVRSNDSHFLLSLVRSHFLIPVLSSFDVCLFISSDLLVVLIANGRDFFELVCFKT